MEGDQTNQDTAQAVDASADTSTADAAQQATDALNTAVSEQFEAPKTEPSTTAPASTDAPAAAADKPAEPAPEAQAPAEPADKTAKLFAEFEALMAADQQARAASATPAATTAQPAAPAATTTAPAPSAGIVEALETAAKKEFGDDFGKQITDTITKPLTEHFEKKLAEADKKLADLLAANKPAQRIIKQIQSQNMAQSEKAVEGFFGKNAAVYGASMAEAKKNPAQWKARAEDARRAADLIEFYESKGKELSEEDALTIAAYPRTKDLPKTAVRQQLNGQMRARTNQRSLPPNSGGGSTKGNWRDEANAEVAKHYG